MMRTIKLQALLCLFAGWTCSLYAQPLPKKPIYRSPSVSAKIDFFSSMEWNDPKNKDLRQLYFPANGVAIKTMFFLKALYDKNNFFERKNTPQAKIPKIIHQIWVGPKTPPEIFKHSQESFKRLHPDWEYKLWTDADIPSLNLHNKKFYDLSTNYGEKADIMRYEILYKFGGVYADVDFMCFKPLDVLCQYDVWASIEPLDCSQGTGINNAIIGSIPGHPLLRHCIETIKDTWYTTSNLFIRVGPQHFKRSFLTFAQENNDNVIAFPKSFFYPLDFRDGLTYLRGKDARKNGRKKVKTTAHILQNKGLEKLIKPEAFAMHLWAGSWRGKKGSGPKKNKNQARKKSAAFKQSAAAA